MNFSDKIPGIILTVREYFLDFYDGEPHIFNNVKKATRRIDDTEALVYQCLTKKDVTGTMYDTGREKDFNLFNELKKLNFYFIVIFKKGKVDDIEVVEEIFDDEASAYQASKKYLLEK